MRGWQIDAQEESLRDLNSNFPPKLIPSVNHEQTDIAGCHFAKSNHIYFRSAEFDSPYFYCMRGAVSWLTESLPDVS